MLMEILEGSDIVCLFKIFFSLSLCLSPSPFLHSLPHLPPHPPPYVCIHVCEEVEVGCFPPLLFWFCSCPANLDSCCLCGAKWSSVYVLCEPCTASLLSFLLPFKLYSTLQLQHFPGPAENLSSESSLRPTEQFGMESGGLC